MRLWRCSTMLSKTHRNLMHLKRKIYFSILTVVNFKINMEMRDQCFRHALSHFFFWIGSIDVMLPFQLFDDCSTFMRRFQRHHPYLFAWLQIGVILALCLFVSPLLCHFSGTVSLGNTHKKLVLSHFCFAPTAAVIFSPMKFCHNLFAVACQTWMK